MIAAAEPLAFRVPDERAAREPPEARGLARDAVRLLVSRPGDEAVVHTRFHRLADFLAAGDVLVVNTSATIAAALAAEREAVNGGRSAVLVHLSSPLSATRWVIELRQETTKGSAPLFDAAAGERLALRDGGTVTLAEPYAPTASPPFPGRLRLWVAELDVPGGVLAFAARHGAPIRYAYVPRRWPLAFYQTVFAREPGSAEMPSAGRAFTPATVERVRRAGVRVAPLVLHTGVSSLETDEAPYPERYRVPASTAALVNDARARGGRIVAVGTTVVRALETVASEHGTVRAGHGWTDLVIAPDRKPRVVDALLTGLHEPSASHLALLEAVGGRAQLERAYDEALRHGYLWHEFGDLHLLLP